MTLNGVDDRLYIKAPGWDPGVGSKTIEEEGFRNAVIVLEFLRLDRHLTDEHEEKKGDEMADQDAHVHLIGRCSGF